MTLTSQTWNTSGHLSLDDILCGFSGLTPVSVEDLPTAEDLRVAIWTNPAGTRLYEGAAGQIVQIAPGEEYDGDNILAMSHTDLIGLCTAGVGPLGETETDLVFDSTTFTYRTVGSLGDTVYPSHLADFLEETHEAFGHDALERVPEAVYVEYLPDTLTLLWKNADHEVVASQQAETATVALAGITTSWPAHEEAVTFADVLAFNKHLTPITVDQLPSEDDILNGQSCELVATPEGVIYNRGGDPLTPVADSYRELVALCRAGRSPDGCIETRLVFDSALKRYRNIDGQGTIHGFGEEFVDKVWGSAWEITGGLCTWEAFEDNQGCRVKYFHRDQTLTWWNEDGRLVATRLLNY